MTRGRKSEKGLVVVRLADTVTAASEPSKPLSGKSIDGAFLVGGQTKSGAGMKHGYETPSGPFYDDPNKRFESGKDENMDD